MMKKTINVFIFLFSYVLAMQITNSQAQWVLQADLQNFTHLDRITFIDNNYGWTIGGSSIGVSGPYFYTNDGGQNWFLHDDWIDVEGTDIAFINPDTGFISSHSGLILKTTNAGQNWTEIQTPTTQDVKRLFFVDENNGWATFQYNSGKLLRTIDSGITWELISCMEVEESGVNVIYFLNDTIGFGGGGATINGDFNMIRKTINLGESWETILSVPNFPYLFSSIYFSNTMQGWVVGQTNASNTYLVLHTEDGGETWEEQTLPELNWYGNPREASIIYSIQFVNDTLGIQSVESAFGDVANR